MNDFSTLNLLALAAKEPADKLKLYLEIIDRAKTDKQFRQTINYEVFMNSSRALAHLLPPPKSKLAIYGYKTLDPWDPFVIETGVPGSEEACIYASEELAKRGYKVTLYLNPPENSIWRSPLCNPQWLPEQAFAAFDNKEYYDIILCWRRFDVPVARTKGRKVYAYLHDSPSTLPRPFLFPPFDGILILSQHHYNQYTELKIMAEVLKDGKPQQMLINQYLNFEKIPYTISGNGYELTQFSQPMSFTNKYSMGYFSNYSRGLSIMLMIWPSIREEFPEATLDIFYGRETWGTAHPKIMDYIVEHIEKYKDLGVTEHGKVGHVELANSMQKTSVWVYPCISLGETFCITAVKCQAAGMIPVTTRVGALDETVHPQAPSAERITTEDKIPQYKNKVLETLRRIRDTREEEIRTEREKYIEFAKQFSWEKTVDKWTKLFG